MAAPTIIFFERKVKESLKKSNSKKILDNLWNNRQIYGHQFDHFYSFSIAHKQFDSFIHSFIHSFDSPVAVADFGIFSLHWSRGVFLLKS